ncbi:MAG: DUF1570 domain-containing protein [bacterium]|nr:DUF1570 domain-containing protein [bacterium]
MRRISFQAFLRVAAVLTLMAVASMAAAQTAHRETWTAVVSPHFTLYTNAEPARGEEIAVSLERFRAVFAQLSPQLELNSPAPTRILAFRDAESYAPYKTVADGESSRVLGQFVSHADGNYITLDAGTRLVGSFNVIYHEYVHYLVRHNFTGVPLWFHEGLAEYYSTFETDGEYALVGQAVERHVQWLRRRAELGLDDVLAVTPRSRKGHGDGAAGRFYAVSWALVHYLLSGDSENLDRTADFFVRLRDGEDPREAFEEAFDLRLRQLEERLARYVAEGELPRAEVPLARLPSPRIEVRPLAPQDALFHLGDLLAHMGRTDAAERHFQLALDEQWDHPETHTGLALVRDISKRYEEAAFFHRDAVELGSSNPLTYLLYGRHLLTRARLTAEKQARAEQYASAREVLRKAVEIDRNFGECWALLGHAHLHGDADAAAGAQVFARARELLPDRADLVTGEIQLLLRLGRIDQADNLVESVLASLAPEATVVKVRDLVERARWLRASEEAFDKNDVDAGLDYFDRAIETTTEPSLRREMEARLLELQQLHER